MNVSHVECRGLLMIKKLDLAILIIEGKACFHPALIEEHEKQDVFERYRNLCEYNNHDPASSEIGDMDAKS